MYSFRFLDELEVVVREMRDANPEWTLAFTRGPTDREKIAAWTEVDSPSWFVQITIWNSGECDLEALDGDGNQLLARAVEVPNPEAVAETAARFFEDLKGVPQARRITSP